MASTNPQTYTYTVQRNRSPLRDALELSLGFIGIVAVLWLPRHSQLIFGPIALLAPLALVLLQRPSIEDLGLGLRGLIPSLWILPAAAILTVAGVLLAQRLGTFHALYRPDLSHVDGYIGWTLYQQFLVQDFFMPRLTRFLSSDGAIAAAAVLFSLAHLPNLSLAAATIVWGAVSCLLFRRYRNLYMIGLAQGILGICFGVCVPDAVVHHMRVGLGYWHYHVGQ